MVNNVRRVTSCGTRWQWHGHYSLFVHLCSAHRLHGADDGMGATAAATLGPVAMWGPRPRLTCSAHLPHVSAKSKRPLHPPRLGRSDTAEIAAAAAAAKMAAAAGELSSNFLQVLLSRRLHLQVPLSVEQGSPVKHPLYQGSGPLRPSQVMESCPRKEVQDFKEKLVEENFYLITELGKQGRVPVLLLRLKDATPKRKPAIVFLHSSYKCKEWLRPLLEAYVSRGYISVAIDCRYHGERASNKATYIDALKSAWRTGDTMPFIFDTVWDLIKLADYLSEREDVDASRIGITGESLGGMHAWFAAFADTRYSAIVPIIGIQGFRWAIDNDMWQARVDSIKPLFEEARIDLGKSEVDKEVVEKVWDKIAPGLDSQFDAPYSIPIITPRPLLILNGAQDPRCPIASLQETVSGTTKAYEEVGCAEKFMFIAEPGIGHQMTAAMVKEASDWFDRFL